MTTADQNGNYHVPKWFVRFVAWSIGLGVLFITAGLGPWGVWLTVTMIKLDARVRDIHKPALDKLELRLEMLEEERRRSWSGPPPGP